MDARGVKNHESGRSRGRTWAGASPMSKLYAETKIFEGILVKILAGPSLQYETIRLTILNLVYLQKGLPLFGAMEYHGAP
jgi:hypothetical protein